MYNIDEYVPDDAVIIHVDEFLKLMKVLTGDKRFEEAAHTVVKSEGSEVRMRSILAEHEERGEARGKEIGEERMGKLVTILLNQNKVEEVKKVTSDKTEREKYYILYNI